MSEAKLYSHAVLVDGGLPLPVPPGADLDQVLAATLGPALERLDRTFESADAYVEFFRGVPLVMVIFWMWFIIPQLLRMPIPEYGVALTAFVIFEAAYFGEIVRAGVQSVPRGQVEAARAIGLTGTQGMIYVILPQALRNMVPALVTQMIVLFKDTSLASIIGYVDLTKAAQIVNNREIKPFELYLFIAVVYWVCTYSMSRIARRFETRTSPA